MAIVAVLPEQFDIANLFFAILAAHSEIVDRQQSAFKQGGASASGLVA
jgi:hypothetical protein